MVCFPVLPLWCCYDFISRVGLEWVNKMDRFDTTSQGFCFPVSLLSLWWSISWIIYFLEINCVHVLTGWCRSSPLMFLFLWFIPSMLGLLFWKLFIYRELVCCWRSLPCCWSHASQMIYLLSPAMIWYNLVWVPFLFIVKHGNSLFW